MKHPHTPPNAPEGTASTWSIQLARPDELLGLCPMLCRAFEHDKSMAWMFPHDQARQQMMPLAFEVELRSCAPGEALWESGGAGIALWMPPSIKRAPDARAEWKLLRACARAGGLRHLLRVFRGMAQLEKARPREPFCHLVLLAVDPTCQSRGLGQSLMRLMAQRCDGGQTPIYVETTNERALPFYERCGFAMRGELVLPGGPPVWCLWREPQPEPQHAKI